ASPNQHMTRTILGIDPGSKYMGVAVLRGPELLAGSVHTLRNGERPYDVIAQARRLILGYVVEFRPNIVAMEEPLLRPTQRAALASVIAQELRARSRELRIETREISPKTTRRLLVGNSYAKKLDIARLIVREHFPELRGRLPKPPKKAVLGFSHRDKYWFHMFDAIAVALAVRFRATLDRRSPGPTAHAP
ncbi:MAG: hypothetical protein ABIH26_06980, partial [Candidatus Eisenbacteria bacterium]